jgi:hypothetical protein
MAPQSGRILLRPHGAFLQDHLQEGLSLTTVSDWERGLCSRRIQAVCQTTTFPRLPGGELLVGELLVGELDGDAELLDGEILVREILGCELGGALL